MLLASVRAHGAFDRRGLQGVIPVACFARFHISLAFPRVQPQPWSTLPAVAVACPLRRYPSPKTGDQSHGRRLGAAPPQSQDSISSHLSERPTILPFAGWSPTAIDGSARRIHSRGYWQGLLLAVDRRLRNTPEPIASDPKLG